MRRTPRIIAHVPTLLVAILITSAGARAQSDIQSTPPGGASADRAPLLQADYDRLAREFEYESMCEAYRRNHDGALDPQAEEVFSHWADAVALDERWADWLGPHIESDALDEHEDPMVRAIGLTYASHSMSPDEVGDSLFDTLSALIDAGYPPLRASMFADTIHDYYDRHGDEAKAHDAETIYAQQYQLACATPDMTNAQRRYVYGRAGRELSAASGIEFGDWFVDGLEATEGVDPWIALMCRGVLEWRRAYNARGSGYASETSDEQWDEFHRLARPAVDSLAHAYELHPDCPEAATELMFTAANHLAPSGTDEYDWFDRAVDAQLDYEQAYREMRHILIPRWSGSFDDMAAFAESLVRPEVAGTSVPYQVLYMIDDYNDERRSWPEDDYTWRVPRFVAAVVAAGDMILEHEQRPGWRTYAGTIAAYAAYKQGDPALGARYLREIDGEISRNGAQIVAARDLGLPGLILPIGTETTRVRARAANAYESLGKWEKAGETWGKLLDTAPEDDALLRAALLDRKTTAEWKGAFEAGEWVELAFDEALTGWRTIDGTWERVDDQAVRMLQGSEYGQLALGIDLGNRYEFEAIVTPPESPKPTFRFGLVYASNLRRTDNNRIFRSFALHPGDGVLRCSWFWGERDLSRPMTAPFDQPHTLRVVHDVDRVRCSFDGEQVFDSSLINPSSMGEPDENRAGLGGFGVGGRQGVEFSHVRVRKLGRTGEDDDRDASNKDDP
ncbi:MAG: hypothetical protein R3B57_13450 [Phycisphaerales bacterium]